MIKKIAWDAFKNTGDINTFLEYKQIENIEENIKKINQLSSEEENIKKINGVTNVKENSKEMNDLSNKD